MIPLSDIVWHQWWALWLLPLPVLVYFGLPARQKTPGRALRVPDSRPYESLTQTSVPASRRHWLRLLLLGLAWCALLLAVARPQSYGEPVGVPLSGRDLMLCIDISGSMREADLYAGNNRATRMAVVKQVASDFVARRDGDRIGLVMFGSQAYVQTPLTLDHATVQHFLAEAAVGLAGRSTAIGDAIGLAVKRLRERPEASRVIILLTDGENSAGVVDPLAAARLAADNNIRIHAIGVGADAQSGFNAPFGARTTELDEETLKAISQSTGGQYFRARNQRELATIYREIDRLEPTEQDAEEFRPLRELFAWPLSAALLFSVLWALAGIWPSGGRQR
ncbi:vWA domain-containing protein [Granulosicoccus sp. 3-233]|uniref:vWA domain-containing protein n=1 Tax=Granulosicoccus sp. 3-233 TaxID=3417969 RepID=UPI003D326884